jgi:hypothetical protein
VQKSRKFTSYVPPPLPSLTMYMLIKDLQRSGTHMCANKRLSGQREFKIDIGWVPHTSQLRVGCLTLP